jgi:hypothetical protein
MNVQDLISKLEDLSLDKLRLNIFKENFKVLANTFDTKTQYQYFSHFIVKIIDINNA